MIKTIKTITLVAIFLIIIISVSALDVIPNSDIAKSNSLAPEHSKVIDSGWKLKRIDIVHYLDSGPSISKKGAGAACYVFIDGIGGKWTNLPVNYVINPTNNQGISENFITSTIKTSAETWDTATSKELFNNIYTIDYSAQYGIRDFKNTIAFGQYSNSNVIAVTSVWIESNPKVQQIVEFDQLYNTRFIWGDATYNPSIMDLQNIATHEFGHAAGLGDIYSSDCSAVTMYGSSNYGEINKRTLESADITGLQKLYDSKRK